MKMCADNAMAKLTMQTISKGSECLWTKFLLMHCQAICFAAKEDFSRAD